MLSCAHLINDVLQKSRQGRTHALLPRHLLTLLLADGSEPNSGSSTPARRLLGVPSGNGSPRDSPSGTLRRHHLNVSGSQLPADDTCDDEPVAVKR